MKTDKPTPIPRRASRPKPITFPKPAPIAPQPRTLDTEEDVRIFVQQCVTQALKEHDTRLARTFYKVVMDWPVAEIMTMGEAEFEAICRSILEDSE